MSGNGDCREIRGLLPELALGIADGEERARLLEHAAACADCQRELEGLAVVADRILELAPEREPPAGFELRVLDAIEPGPARRRRFRPALALAATGLAAAALAAGAVLFAVRGDRNLARHYRSALAEAHGSYFGSARLRDASGAEGGVVFVYRGAPSWLLVTVDPSSRGAVRRAEVVAADGRRFPLSWFRLSEGTWGGPVPIDLREISSVRLLGPGGATVLGARLPHGS